MARVRDYRREANEGDTIAVKVGDVVGFKSDYEQAGVIIAISGDDLTLENEQGFGGDYLRYATTTVETADRCWVE